MLFVTVVKNINNTCITANFSNSVVECKEMGSYAFTNNSAIQMFSHEKSGGGRFFFLHDHVLRQE